MNKNKTLRIAMCGVMTAFVCLATFINIRLPFVSNGGLVHLGGIVLIISAYLMPPLDAGVSMGLGMALFDILGGWTAWAPFTFVIRFCQTYVLSDFLASGKKGREITGLIFACVIEMAGYYMAEVILYGNWIVPVSSMPGEAALNILGIIVGVPLARTLVKYKFSYKNK